MNNRLIRIGISSAFAVYMAMVCFNNITDYQANLSFVSNVSGMTDVLDRERSGWRAVSNRNVHHLLFVVIIIVEIFISCLLMGGSMNMIRNYKSAPEVFQASKRLSITGLALGVLLFLVIFITIAGEWFLMWQSTQWNALPSAFSVSSLFLLALIFMTQNEN